jgi:hypothetical protein
MQELHANMGACMPATLAGPIHKTRVQRWPQYSQQIPSTHGFRSSVWAGAGRPPRANSAIPGITIRSSTESLSSSIPTGRRWFRSSRHASTFVHRALAPNGALRRGAASWSIVTGGRM